MIVDVHTHIFPDEMRDRRYKLFKNEPEFQSIYENSSTKMVSYEELLVAMDENGVDISVIFGFPWNTYEFAKVNNDYVIEAVKKYPDKFIGMCCINPFNKNAINEVERCLKAGLKGVGEIAFYHSDITHDIIKSLEDIMRLCREFKVPFMLHTNEPVGHEYPGKADMKLKSIYNFLKTYPENKIILAHLGGGIFFYNIMKKEVEDVLKNVYFDTAAVPFLYKNEIYNESLKFAGKDKILFGSDYPLIKPARYFKDINEVITDKELNLKIKGKNALKLWRL